MRHATCPNLWFPICELDIPVRHLMALVRAFHISNTNVCWLSPNGGKAMKQKLYTFSFSRDRTTTPTYKTIQIISVEGERWVEIANRVN